MAQDFVTLLKKEHNLKHQSLLSGIFNLMLSDHGWPWVSKTLEWKPQTRGDYYIA